MQRCRWRREWPGLWGDPQTTAHALGPWAGFACLCGYAIVLTALAAWQLRRRDA